MYAGIDECSQFCPATFSRHFNLHWLSVKRRLYDAGLHGASFNQYAFEPSGPAKYMTGRYVLQFRSGKSNDRMLFGGS